MSTPSPHIENIMMLYPLRKFEYSREELKDRFIQIL